MNHRRDRSRIVMDTEYARSPNIEASPIITLEGPLVVPRREIDHFDSAIVQRRQVQAVVGDSKSAGRAVVRWFPESARRVGLAEVYAGDTGTGTYGRKRSTNPVLKTVGRQRTLWRGGFDDGEVWAGPAHAAAGGALAAER